MNAIYKTSKRSDKCTTRIYKKDEKFSERYLWYTSDISSQILSTVLKYMDTDITWYRVQFKSITTSSVQRRSPSTMRYLLHDRQPRRSPSALRRLHFTLLPSFLSLPDNDMRHKCIHERLAAVRRRDVWRIREKARFSVRDERRSCEKKKRAMKMWGKISRVRHPVLLSRWFWWIRGENSCRFSARLARREDVGIFHRDADISQIYNGNSDALFFVNAKQYCGQCTYRVTWVTFCNDSVWSTVCRRLLESRIKDRDTIMSRCTIKIYSNKYTQKDIPFFCDILLISEDFPLVHGFKKIFKMQRKIIQS